VVGSGAFAVNLLHGEAQQVAALFASGAPDRFDRVVWQRTAINGCPALTEAAHAIADCVVDRVHPAGDHMIVVGVVRGVERLRDRSALLYGFRSYSQWEHIPVPAVSQR
jgi:flavin reductase (DIM6/NTAB) family NADH-FMN oxidoreductase RutF